MRVVSGIQPSGMLHLGNYFGAVRTHIALQETAGGVDHAFFFLADLHALTTVHDRTRLRTLTREMAIDYLALGLDPRRATLFRQSDVPEVCELAWLLSTCVGLGALERAHAYKDRRARGEAPSVALFTYPVLMAADILALRGTTVPVGRDQQQHVEMAQDIAGNFHAAYACGIFARPEWLFSDAPVVPGIDGTKMSKSRGNVIPIFTPAGMTERATWKTYFASIVTDSRGVADPKDPNDTLMTLYRMLAPARAAAIEPAYARGGVSYGEMKKALHAAYEETFASARERRQRIARDAAYVEDVLRDGAGRARAVARGVLAEACDACGIATPAALVAASGDRSLAMERREA